MTETLLDERGSTYGDFEVGCKLEANVLEMITASYAYHHEEEMRTEHMIYFSKILMKLSRLAVTPDHQDSWDDIAGYATLVSKTLKGKSNA